MASEQKRLFLALILSGLVLFTWQTYFAPKKPVISQAVTTKKQNEGANKPTRVSEEEPQKKINVVDGRLREELSEVSLVNANGGILTLKSDLSVVNMKSPSVQDDFKEIVGSNLPLQFFILNGENLVPLNFSIEEGSSGLTGYDSVNNVNFSLKKTNSELYDWQITSDSALKLVVVMKSMEKEDESRQIRQFVHLQESVDRYSIDDEEVYEGKTKWVGIDYHYHLFATVFDEKVSTQTFIKDKSLTLKSLESRKSFSGKITFTIKELAHLQKLGHKLDLSIDYGIFGIIAVPLLKGMKFFYKFIPNYGLAIILLTLLIRTLLFPLQFKSFKSMKKMQKLQPQLQKIKEKHKDDPQRVQKETMELFKKNGANPLGGCLPMLMQMPVFFAMYQVFLHSVELVNQPFILWIQDLSVKDPYYVLPALMGGSFFLQTKLNPSTTTDPSQQKIMLIMPLIFPFFMKDLPAGLNLYMTISTAFGILQQMIVYKVIDD